MLQAMNHLVGIVSVHMNSHPEFVFPDSVFENSLLEHYRVCIRTNKDESVHEHTQYYLEIEFTGEPTTFIPRLYASSVSYLFTMIISYLDRDRYELTKSGELCIRTTVDVTKVARTAFGLGTEL